MNFQTLLKVETDDFYIGKAFRNGTKRADSAREKKFNSALSKSRFIELERMKAVRQSLHDDLNSILTSFPSIDRLPEFYVELVKISLDYSKLKKSLGAVNWAKDKVSEFYGMHAQKVSRTQDAKQINTYRRMFYGRAASALKQIRKELLFLEESRKKMKAFPSIKTGIRTIVIAGYPNVGKTTLLKKLTNSEPKIAPYPFTTQRIMLGYLNKEDEKIQIVDTPGLLDRPLEKRNKIEKQAVLALKHLANKIVFVIDASGTSGYGTEIQVNLLNGIRKNFESELIIAINKSDITEEKEIGKLIAALKGLKTIRISAEKGTGIKELLEAL